MKIHSLSNYIEHSAEIARWYHDEWVDDSSAVTVVDVENEIREKANLSDEIPHYYIALENERLLGVVELKYRENRNHLEYVHWLGGLYVSPKMRSKNIGSNLIRFAKSKASEIGVVEFYLQCEKALIPMYEKHAFKQLHKAKHGNWETMIMSCAIS